MTITPYRLHLPAPDVGREGGVGEGAVNDALLTTRQAALYCRMHLVHFRRLVYAGIIPSARNNRRHYVRQSDLDAFLEKRRHLRVRLVKRGRPELTLRKAAEILGISYQAVHSLQMRGRLPRPLTRAAVEALKAEREANPPAARLCGGITHREAAQLLGVSGRWVNVCQARGRLPRPLTRSSVEALRAEREANPPRRGRRPKVSR